MNSSISFLYNYTVEICFDIERIRHNTKRIIVWEIIVIGINSVYNLDTAYRPFFLPIGPRWFQYSRYKQLRPTTDSRQNKDLDHNALLYLSS